MSTSGRPKKRWRNGGKAEGQTDCKLPLSDYLYVFLLKCLFRETNSVVSKYGAEKNN